MPLGCVRDRLRARAGSRSLIRPGGGRLEAAPPEWTECGARLRCAVSSRRDRHPRHDDPNRLRRCDRWIAGPQAWRLRRSPRPPIVVDLGYGASPITAVELHQRLGVVRPDVGVVGVEIDPERVAAGSR